MKITVLGTAQDVSVALLSGSSAGGLADYARSRATSSGSPTSG
jgi:hypothetical protein